jgi:hypothetical protein
MDNKQKTNGRRRKVNYTKIAVSAILVAVLGLVLVYIAINWQAFVFAAMEPKRTMQAYEFLYKEGANAYDKTLSTVLSPLAQ